MSGMEILIKSLGIDPKEITEAASNAKKFAEVHTALMKALNDKLDLIASHVGADVSAINERPEVLELKKAA